MQLLTSYSTQFYVSDVGYLVIKQDTGFNKTDEHYLLTPEQTKILFNLLPDLMKQQTERWTGLYVVDKE
jgi:hypothetical protein|tara:strand:- start:383 stop:589 length:207 start_codon:yes stop_codon:yes gene_type:complete